MSRTADRAMSFASVLALAASVLVIAPGCSSLDGRNKNRAGNRYFRERQFSDAAAAFEHALTEVNEPTVQFNLGLAYAKLFRTGDAKPILLGKVDEDVCKTIPKVKSIEAQVCVKPNDRTYTPCDDKNICPSSAKCEKTTFCATDSPTLANLSAEHLVVWVKAQPSDDELRVKVKELDVQLEPRQKELNDLDGKLQAAEIENSKPENSKPGGKKVDVSEIQLRKNELTEQVKKLKIQRDELTLKEDIQGIMTQNWINSDQFKSALEYWEGVLKAQPGDLHIMAKVAGINNKAGQWREAFDWYNKAADLTKDDGVKVNLFMSIGNITWAKLNSKSLGPADSIELADKGIGALQKASALQPENPKPIGLMASIFMFRALSSGAAWAAALDRATAQDLQHTVGVLKEKQKANKAAPTDSSTKPGGKAPDKAGG